MVELMGRVISYIRGYPGGRGVYIQGGDTSAAGYNAVSDPISSVGSNSVTWTDGSSSLRHLVRIEDNSQLDGKQLNGIDDITLTSYIWEYLGSPCPEGVCGN